MPKKNIEDEEEDCISMEESDDEGYFDQRNTISVGEIDFVYQTEDNLTEETEENESNNNNDNKCGAGKQDLRDPQGNPFPLGALGYPR
jgi:hypothetical protein